MEEVLSQEVGIIIPNAGGKVVRRCLNSIRLHTEQAYRIFVVSQGDLGDLRWLLQQNDVCVWNNKENEPGSRGYNRGILLALKTSAQIKYLLFMDDDVLVLRKGWLAALVRKLVERPDWGIVGYEFCVKGEIREDNTVLEFMSCCMLCRIELVREIGLMDELLLWHCNDSDYCRRAWLAGWKVGIVRDNSINDRVNDWLRHSHLVGTRRLHNEQELREQTYKIFDDKWRDIDVFRVFQATDKTKYNKEARL